MAFEVNQTPKTEKRLQPRGQRRWEASRHRGIAIPPAIRHHSRGALRIPCSPERRNSPLSSGVVVPLR